MEREYVKIGSRPVIAHLLPWRINGIAGSTRFVCDLVKSQVEWAEVHIFCPGDGDAGIWRPYLQGARIHPVSSTQIGTRALIDLRPDLIHHHSPDIDWLVKGLPFRYASVATAHSYQPNLPETRRQNVIPIAGPDCKIRHGVDLDKYRPNPSHNDTFVVGIVGRTSPERFPTSFEKQLSKWQAPPNVRVRIIGPGGKRLSLARSQFIEYVGEVLPDKMPDVYQGINAVLVPCISESVGYAVIEAMACGLPVIARAAQGLPDTIGDAGELCADDASLLRAVEDLSTNSARRAELSAKARARAERLFDIRRMVADYEKVYAERSKGLVRRVKHGATALRVYRQSSSPVGDLPQIMVGGIQGQNGRPSATTGRMLWLSKPGTVGDALNAGLRVCDTEYVVAPSGRRFSRYAAIKVGGWNERGDDADLCQRIVCHAGQAAASPRPTVAVVMAVHNTNPEWLHEAVQSVLNQSVTPDEFIIVDDGSTDEGTRSELARLPDSCRVIHLPSNVGAGPARNIAIESAKSEWIANMDSDDIAEPDWLRRMFAYQADHKECDAIGCHVHFMDNRKADPKLPRIVDADSAKRLSWIACNPGILLRRDFVIAAGGYGAMKTAEDLDLWRRMLTRGAVLHNMPDALIRYRTTTESLVRDASHARNVKAVMDAPMTAKRLLVGSYFLPDNDSAGGGPNKYIEHVKYLERAHGYRVKWVHSMPGEMRAAGQEIPQATLALRRRWSCERIALGDVTAMSAVLKRFKPDLVIPLGWQLTADLANAKKSAGCSAPLMSRVEHVGFHAGETSLAKATIQSTRTAFQWQINCKPAELAAYRGADVLLPVSQTETDLLREYFPDKPIRFLRDWIDVQERQYNPDTTSKDIVFLGGTWHRGSVDAIVWFLKECWPTIKDKSPSTRLKITGICGPGLGSWNVVEPILRKYGEDIVNLGYVDDLADVFTDIACSIAPVITGSGIKIKAQTSFSYRCPCILTATAAGEFGLGSEFSPMIGADADDYANKVLAAIKDKETRRPLMALVDCFNEAWSPEESQRMLDDLVTQPIAVEPEAPQRIITAANCLTMPIADRVQQLFQARSDVLVRLLRGEVNESNYRELDDYFKPGMVTPLPRSLPAAWDVFLWSNMVDETTHAVDFHGWPFGPNLAYNVSLRPNKRAEFFAKYPVIPKPTLDERAANYKEIDRLLVAANPKVRRVVLLYDPSTFLTEKPKAAASYIASAEHMAAMMEPLGWEVYRVPADAPRRAKDSHWAHYDEAWTRQWLLDILEAQRAV